MNPSWAPTDFITSAGEWDKLDGRFKHLPFFFIWEVWLARNRLVFENKAFDISHIYTSILRWIDELPKMTVMVIDGSHRIRPHEISIPAFFFDGACMDGIIGCGAWVKLSHRERIHLFWNGGTGSNNKAEFMAIWGALMAAINLKISNVNFYGDSKIVVDSIMGNIQLSNPGLQGWFQREKYLWVRLNRPPINHIFRENNTRADGLSKRGIKANFGCIQVLHYRDGSLIWENSIPLP